MGESSNFNGIVAEPLTEETKEDWFEWVKNYLISQDLWKVTSRSSRPERYRVKDYARWRRKNATALHVMHISCGHHNLPFLRGASEAKVAWEILYHTYHSPAPNLSQHHSEYRSQESPAFPNTKGRYNPPEIGLGDTTPPPDVGEPCSLLLDVPLRRVVASAVVYMHATTHHHKQIQDDQLMVNIASVREGEEGIDIPFPDDEVVKLGQTIGSFILWPQRLVHMATIPPMDQGQAARFPFLSQLQNIHTKIKKVDLHMPCGIVGRLISYAYAVDMKDIREFLSLEEIDIGWVTIAINCFHKICGQMERNTSYGFLCPGRLARNQNKLEERMGYVGYTIGETQLPCYLAPIGESYHWSLCVACPLINVIFWFDSLHRKPNEEIKTIFDIALKTYYLMGGRCENKIADTKWYWPKCPQQPGKTECGYYVLLNMYSIIVSGLTSNFEQIFGNEEPYTVEDINVIRNLLARHLLEQIEDV